MGEAKNRKAAIGSAAAVNLTREALDQLERDLIDKGLLIEAGFASLRAMAMAPDAPPEQVHEMRMAFFAGAQHLFGSIMQTLDPEAEPTDADMRRMDRIDAELRAFIDDFQLRHLPTEGRA